MKNINIDDYIEKRKTIYTTEDSLTGHIEVCEGYYDGGYMRFLLVDDAMQSAYYLEPDMEYELPFDYMECFNWIFSINKRIRKTLLIGGGGFAYPKYYLDMYPDKYIDAIEISETVVDTARAYFGLDDLEARHGDHLKVIVGDGNKFLIDRALTIREEERHEHLKYKDGTDRSQTENGRPLFDVRGLLGNLKKSATEKPGPASSESELRYDVIINDAYVGFKSSDILKKSAELIKSCLTKDGIYVANVVIPLKGEKARRYQKEMEVFEEVFKHTYLMQCDEEINPYAYQNCVFFASDRPIV